MVDIYSAYKVLNTSVLNVLQDIIPLTVNEDYEEFDYCPEFEDATIDLASINKRTIKRGIVGHRLPQYVNKFYSISLDNQPETMIDVLLDAKVTDIGLIEFMEGTDVTASN